MMINEDYKIEALNILLQKDCLPVSYHPLTDGREKLLEGLKKLGCVRKSDVSRLSDEALLDLGLADHAAVRLFRRFLTLYDTKPQKLHELAKLTADPAEREAFEELYHLPGVKATRAALYYYAGYKSVKAIAETTVEEVLAGTARAIAERQLSCTAPFPKEVRTHIAVAKAFCYEESEG